MAFNASIFGERTEVVISEGTHEISAHEEKQNTYNTNARNNTNGRQTPKMKNMKCDRCDTILFPRYTTKKPPIGRVFYSCNPCNNFIGFDENLYNDKNGIPNPPAQNTQNTNAGNELQNGIQRQFQQTTRIHEQDDPNDVFGSMVRCNCGHIASLQQSKKGSYYYKCAKSNGRTCRFFQMLNKTSEGLKTILRIHFFIVKKMEAIQNGETVEDKFLENESLLYFSTNLRFGFYQPAFRITVDHVQQMLNVTPEFISYCEHTSQRCFPWHVARWLRRTGSKFGNYAWLNYMSSPLLTLKEETMPFAGNVYTERGTVGEDTTMNHYIFALDNWLSRFCASKTMESTTSRVIDPSIKFGDCGLIPNWKHPYIGFSPDGLVEFKNPMSHEMMYGVAEFKTLSSELPRNKPECRRQPSHRIPTGIKPEHWAQVVGGIANLNDRMEVQASTRGIEYTFGDLFYLQLTGLANSLPQEEIVLLNQNTDDHTFMYETQENYVNRGTDNIMEYCQWKRIQYNQEDWDDYLLPRIKRYHERYFLPNIVAFLNKEIGPGQVLPEVQERILQDYARLPPQEKLPYHKYEAEFEEFRRANAKPIQQI
jgi:hypothetical protein